MQRSASVSSMFSLVPVRRVLTGLCAGVLLFQLGLRVSLRRRPRPIPYGWTWLLENRWRRHYRGPERVAEACALHPGDRVLEIGCGSGLFTPALAARCAHLTALDLEPRYLATAADRTAHLSHVTLLQGDMQALPCQGASMDVVVLISALTESLRPVAALQEAVRVLRPGGRVVVGEEMFAPEYVRSATLDRWAREAGLQRVRREGNAWAYLHTYRRA
jgi:ubiquinone/menaquinone biosynthesis C-methylase UbiE